MWTSCGKTVLLISLILSLNGIQVFCQFVVPRNPKPLPKCEVCRKTSGNTLNRPTANITRNVLTMGNQGVPDLPNTIAANPGELILLQERNIPQDIVSNIAQCRQCSGLQPTVKFVPITQCQQSSNVPPYNPTTHSSNLPQTFPELTPAYNPPTHSSNIAQTLPRNVISAEPLYQTLPSVQSPTQATGISVGNINFMTQPSQSFFVDKGSYSANQNKQCPQNVQPKQSVHQASNNNAPTISTVSSQANHVSDIQTTSNIPTQEAAVNNFQSMMQNGYGLSNQQICNTPETTFAVTKETSECESVLTNPKPANAFTQYKLLKPRPNPTPNRIIINKKYSCNQPSQGLEGTQYNIQSQNVLQKTANLLPPPQSSAPAQVQISQTNTYPNLQLINNQPASNIFNPKLTASANSAVAINSFTQNTYPLSEPRPILPSQDILPSNIPVASNIKPESVSAPPTVHPITGNEEYKNIQTTSTNAQVSVQQDYKTAEANTLVTSTEATNTAVTSSVTSVTSEVKEIVDTPEQNSNIPMNVHVNIPAINLPAPTVLNPPIVSSIPFQPANAPVVPSFPLIPQVQPIIIEGSRSKFRKWLPILVAALLTDNQGNGCCRCTRSCDDNNNIPIPNPIPTSIEQT